MAPCLPRKISACWPMQCYDAMPSLAYEECQGLLVSALLRAEQSTHNYPCSAHVKFWVYVCPGYEPTADAKGRLEHHSEYLSHDTTSTSVQDVSFRSFMMNIKPDHAHGTV